MKKVVIVLTVLFGVVLGIASCHHNRSHDYYYNDPYWDDHYYYNDPYYDRYYDHYYDHYYPADHNCYNYIRSGRWYPASHQGLDRCGYNSYTVFNDWEILHYDCTDYRYDRGRYKYDNGHIYITYDNGDHVHYFINKACNNELILRCDNGQELHYVRN